MTVQEEIEHLLATGLSRRLAEMFAHQQPPGCKTEREFFRGHCNGSQFAGEEVAGNFYASVARRAGVDITGKVYLSGLAAYPGDPQAWVADKADVRRVVEERGWSCSGDVKIKGPEPAPSEKPPVRLADDIVDELIVAKTERDPGLAKKPRQELKEMVIDQHGGPT